MQKKISFRIEAHVLNMIQSLAEKYSITTTEMLRDLIKSGLEHCANTGADTAVLSHMQRRKLERLNLHCAYQNMMILKHGLMKEEPEVLQKIERESKQEIQRLLGIASQDKA